MKAKLGLSREAIPNQLIRRDSHPLTEPFLQLLFRSVDGRLPT